MKQLIVLLSLFVGIQANAGFLDFLSGGSGNSGSGSSGSGNQHNTPQEQQNVQYSPPAPPKILGNVDFRDLDKNEMKVLSTQGSIVRSANIDGMQPTDPLVDSGRIANCKVVRNQRPPDKLEGVGADLKNEKGIFVPTGSPEEWQAFAGHLPSQVTLEDCKREYVFPGACRHIQNTNYENGESSAASLMTCTRNISLATVGDIPTDTDKIYIMAEGTSLDYNKRGNFLETSGSNNLCSKGYRFGSADLNASGGTYQSGGYGRKFYVMKFNYDKATGNISVRTEADGWGDCREDSCAACIGDIKVCIGDDCV